MAAPLQASLLDVDSEPTLHPLADAERVPLSAGAWLDVRPGWLSGTDALFDAVSERVPWYGERRKMYDRIVDVPRMLCFFDSDDPLPHPVLDAARDDLSRHYRPELGEDFRTAGMCLYRDGRDSVAWHGDTLGRGRREDTMVAILSLGSPRHLLLRPRGGGPSRRFPLAAGDLVVMGGSCQRTWEHCIPKTARPVGPRISIQFRPHGVR